MTPPRPRSPITAMWAWDNPVDPALDPRGRGYAPAAADRLAAFAQAGGLREVHLLVAPGPAGGPVDDWLRATVAGLHDAGVAVSAVAVAGEATAAWAATTTALAPFDRLQVAVVPWTETGDDAGGEPGRDADGASGGEHGAVPGSPPGTPLGPVRPDRVRPDRARSAAQISGEVIDALEALRSTGPGIPVDAAVPWWFATEAGNDGRTLLERVTEAADRVALAAPAAHAGGPGGVLELASPAVDLLVAAGRPFSIGVQADSPGVAGGAHRTFWEEGPVALIRECGAVAAALTEVPSFEGVAVKAHRSWRGLLGV